MIGLYEKLIGLLTSLINQCRERRILLFEGSLSWRYSEVHFVLKTLADEEEIATRRGEIET